MQLRIIILVFFISFGSLFAQDKKSKGDIHFYSYAYSDAIESYKEEMAKGSLTNEQLLNLADSYFQVENYENASSLYIDVNKNDTIMTVHQFNKMLQSLAKTSELERVKTFLGTKGSILSNELMENANFNFELFEANSAKDNSNFRIFNIGANSAQSDFSPAFYQDRFLFSSGRGKKSKKRYEPSGEAYLDIFVGRANADGNVLSANLFTGVPDSDYHKSTPF